MPVVLQEVSSQSPKDSNLRLFIISHISMCVDLCLSFHMSVSMPFLHIDIHRCIYRVFTHMSYLNMCESPHINANIAPHEQVTEVMNLRIPVQNLARSRCAWRRCVRIAHDLFSDETDMKKNEGKQGVS